MSFTAWQQVEGDGLVFDEIVYEKKRHTELEGGVARITINKPATLNTMTLHTVDEMFRAFYDANHDPVVGVLVVAGAGKHFGAGGDVEWERWGLREAFYNRYPHNRLLRLSRKPIIAQVQGYCLGGHNHMAYCCDFTIAADTAIFGQTGPRVGSVDAGHGTGFLARAVGEKKAREIWYMCRQYGAHDALAMGLVNKVVPLKDLRAEVETWCAELLEKSPTALALAKQSFNIDSEQRAGVAQFAHTALGLYYQTEEAMEGRNAFVEKRPVNFSKFRK